MTRWRGAALSKTVAGSREAFTWNAAEGLCLLRQEGSTRYVTGPDDRPLEQVSSNDTMLYYDQDQLGSTRAVLNGASQVVGAYTYDAYGHQTVISGTVSTPFGYAGRYTDAETGLQYLWVRYYDPATAQFLTRDPLQDVSGQPYGYAVDAPSTMSIRRAGFGGPLLELSVERGSTYWPRR